MNAKKKYSSLVATALIAFVALFGVVPLSAYAAGPAVRGVLFSDPSYCKPCRDIQGLYSSVPQNSLSVLKPTDPLYPGGGIPQLQLYDAQGNPVGSAIKGKGQDMLDALNELKNQPPKQQDEKICIVPRPGQSYEFGPLTDDPGLFPIRGPIQDTSAVHPVIAGHITDESDVNFNLRKLGSETMEIELAHADQQKVEGGTKKVIRPNQTQAEEYIKSMKGNADARGSYKIDGTDVPVGKYRANQPDESTGITFDKNCENPKKTGPAPDPGKTPPGGANPGFGDLGNGGGGGGGGFGGGGGGLGGGAGGALGQLLPLLMQGLMGGGQGGQQGQGQQGQNQYGAGYGNQQKCDAQTVAPVCGMDGKTYNNACFLNNQYPPVILRNTGVCATPSTGSGQATVNSIVTLAQLAQSGIPAALLDNVRNLVSSVLSGIVSGANISETVVQ